MEASPESSGQSLALRRLRSIRGAPDGGLHQLVRQRDAVRERTLEITFLEPGAEAYAFTFG
jgi:Thioredoxin like C-terminal domain